MSYEDDKLAAHVARQSSITASSTASQIKTAETKFYRALYQAQLKWGVVNGSAEALQSRGERLPNAGETP